MLRRHGREDGRPELSLRFVGLPEVTEELIRRQLSARLSPKPRRPVHDDLVRREFTAAA